MVKFFLRPVNQYGHLRAMGGAGSGGKKGRGGRGEDVEDEGELVSY